MTETAEIVRQDPFIQKEAYYLDDSLNIVQVKFSFFHEDQNVRIKFDAHRFGANSEGGLHIEDRLIDRETLFTDLNQRIEKHLSKTGPLDVQVAPLDCLIRAAIPTIPGIHRFIDIYGGDITVNGRRHALNRTRLKASRDGVEIQGHAIVPKRDSEDATGKITNATVYLNGARTMVDEVMGIQSSTVRELEDFLFFRFYGLSTGFTVEPSFFEENEARTAAAKALLRIPHDMQYTAYVLPTTTDLMELISQTRESEETRIRTAHKRNIDIDI